MPIEKTLLNPDLFKIDLTSADISIIEKFNNIYTEKNGDWQAISTSLKEDADFPTPLADKLQFTQDLNFWTSGNEKLINHFQLDDTTNSFRDIALKYDQSELNDIVVQVGIPADTTVKSYVTDLSNSLFQIQPTATLIKTLNDDLAVDQSLLEKAKIENPDIVSNINYKIDVREGVKSFLEKHTDFDIKKDSLYQFFNQNDAFEGIEPEIIEPVKNILIEWQRITAISPVLEIIPILIGEGFTSALSISEIPQENFVQRFKDSISENGEAVARQIHTNAVNARIRNENALISLKDAYKGTGISFIDKTLNVTNYKENNDISLQSILNNTTFKNANIDLPEENKLSWDLLFGDADSCECGECTSVYSAAAYFVDLLQYLRNNNLKPIDPPETVSSPSGVVKIDPKFPIYLPTPIKLPISKLSDPPKDVLKDSTEKLTDSEIEIPITNKTVMFTTSLESDTDETNASETNINLTDESDSPISAPVGKTTMAWADAEGNLVKVVEQKSIFPLEILFNRRPDLGELELTCQNTNTVLPYVDLANEIMESYVASKIIKSKIIKSFNITEDDTSEELLSEPKHTEFRAYEKLKDKVYPFNLPYHQPIDAIRIYLEYLGTSRVELIEIVQSLQNDKTEKLNTRVIDAEYLGLTEVEYKLITNEYSDSTIKDNKERQVFEYFGYENEETMLDQTKSGLTFVKDQFLRRTGIEFTDLINILNTQYLSKNCNCLEITFEPIKKGEFVDGKWTTDTQIFDLSGNTLAAGNLGDWTVDKHTEILEHKKLIVKASDKTKIPEFFTIRIDSNCQVNLTRIKKSEDPKVKVFDETTISIGKLDCAKGEMSGGILSGKEVDFTKNDWLFTALDDLKGFVKDGVLIDAETNQPFVNPIIVTGNCELNKARLTHIYDSPVTAEEYDRIQQFIRLWKRLDWTIDEVDNALLGLGQNSEGTPSITPEFLHQVVLIKKLQEKTGLDITRLLTFWTEINTTNENSLFEQLFLKHNLSKFDPELEIDNKGNFISNKSTDSPKISEHLPIIMAVLNLSSNDITAIENDIAAIQNESKFDDELTLINVSILYRYRLLATLLNLRIPALINVLNLFDKELPEGEYRKQHDVFSTPDQTLEFFDCWTRMEDAGFDYQQLNFLIKNNDDSNKPLSSSELSIIQIAKKLFDGLNSIDETYSNALKAIDLNTLRSIEDHSLSIEENLEENEITVDWIRSKITLIFDAKTVESIIYILENIFSSLAPKNLVFEIENGSSLKTKLNYDAVNGIIIINGLLNDKEESELKDLSLQFKIETDVDQLEKDRKDWGNSVNSINQQQNDYIKKQGTFVESLSIVFEVNKQNGSAEDLFNSQKPTIEKRFELLKVFLPYLLKELKNAFVLNTLSEMFGLDRIKINYLISTFPFSTDVEKSIDPLTEVFNRINKPTKNNLQNQVGYLIPSIESDYKFFIKKDPQAEKDPTLIFDNSKISLEKSSSEKIESDGEWFGSDSLKLQAGKIYKLEVSDSDIKDLYWKTSISPIVSIPNSELIPDFVLDNVRPTIITLKKLLMIITGFNLSIDEVDFFAKISKDALNFLDLTLETFLHLEAYTRFRNSLPRTQNNVLDFFKWVEAQEKASGGINKDLVEKLVTSTAWKSEQIKQIISNVEITNITNFRNVEFLLKLQKALKVGIDFNLLYDWAKSTSDFEKCHKVAEGIKNEIRLQHDQKDWETVTKPLNDKLRDNQKNALISFLLQDKELRDFGVREADGLFEFFLIDVQMDPCMETSRIKQAISSVQLFIQRCFLGLEKDIPPNLLDRNRWEWMQRYRVWEANRKVFLYPENWIESNLRDDKSSFFRELESELLQKDINQQSVKDALTNYLYKLDEVANMEIVGTYIEGTQSIDAKSNYSWSENAKLHVFSRTRYEPYFYYYRYLSISEGNWYPWEKIQIDIPNYDAEDTRRSVFQPDPTLPVPVDPPTEKPKPPVTHDHDHSAEVTYDPKHPGVKIYPH